LNVCINKYLFPCHGWWYSQENRKAFFMTGPKQVPS